MRKFRTIGFRRNPTLWTVLLLLTLLISINFAGWLFYLGIKEILDDELGKRLQSLAMAVTLLMDSNKVFEYVTDAKREDIKIELQGELTKYQEMTKLGDIYLIGPNYQILIQTRNESGSIDPLLLVDQDEISQAFAGKSTVGFLYRVGKTYYKRGYAPIRSLGGDNIAVLGVEASAEYFGATNKIRNSLQFLGLVSIILILMTLLVLNRILAMIFRLEERVLQADKWESLAQLSAGVAHEIRNPLGIISGNAELLKEESREGKYKDELIENIITETDRMNKILGNYLEFSRPGSLELKEQDMNEILDRTLQLCQHQLTKSGVVVIKEYQSGLPKIRVDRERITQVFLNLILNARESMVQGGWLKVRSLSDPSNIIIEIIDDGMGIKPEYLTRIFDPFFTLKKTGSGLGLSIAKRIIEDHSGEITIQSEQDKGTTARVILPLISSIPGKKL